MHGAYRRTFGPEHVLELTKNINVQHDDYLKQDDPDKKADALRYMAGYVAQYLHLVPHEKKFTFKETERVLHNSAMNIGDFDPREGSLSFRHLARYAENLMEQPWRTDFHTIKLTAGFYVHNIAAQLQNAHEILIAMGYVNIDDTTLKLIPIRDYSTLKAVSKDCYIASQECLILSQIWQHVADAEPDYPLTIGEVFECRKNHLGDTDTICNKMLFDIRSRMHSIKHQQQQIQQYQNNNQPVPHLKNSQRFVPVDRLIDYDIEDVNGDEPDNIGPESRNFIPEREVERVQDLIKNVNVQSYNQDDEHIYDPVYGSEEESPSTQYHRQPYQHQQPQRQPRYSQPPELVSGQYLYNSGSNNNNIGSSRKSVSNVQFDPYQYQAQQFRNNFNNGTSNNVIYSGSDGRNSQSPMIPKTVTAMFSNSNGIQSSGSRSSVGKSNSMNNIVGARPGGATSSSSSSASQAQTRANHPLTRTKIKETDLDADLLTMSPTRENFNYFNQIGVGNPYPGPNVSSIDMNRRSRKSVPAMPLTASSSGAGAFAPAQNQVYPDQYYPAPQIVKPLPVYGSSVNTSQLLRSRINSDNGDDVLNDALLYASQVSQMSMLNSTNSREDANLSYNYQHQATPIPNPGSDSDSNQYTYNNLQKESAIKREGTGGRSSASTDMSSSREGSVLAPTEGYGLPRQMNRKSELVQRPTHIDLHSRRNERDLPYADSSPEDAVQEQRQQHQQRQNNGYRELSSSSSGESPASISARSYPKNEDLNSLDTVYYDYLLKKGNTDKVMGNNSADNSHSQSQQDTKRTHSSKNSSHLQNSNTQHANHFAGSESDENHLYDGRRVIPKKKQQPDKNVVKRERRKSQNAVESAYPSSSASAAANYEQQRLGNFSSTMTAEKPGYDKNIRKSEKEPVESEVPCETSITVKVEPWDCRFCTFKNYTSEKICEMCAKSKDFFEDETPNLALVAHQRLVNEQGDGVHLPKLFSVKRETPNPKFNIKITPNPEAHSAQSQIAGAAASEVEDEQVACPQCTLLNSKRARVCEVCNNRLKPLESPKGLEELAYDIR